ncbi:hypothetical protein AGR7A_pAt20196 [Agrobacterium deltaense NCPPB 1641]|uniref:Uncharacterized protein n=1 Tax=Agrobacterium deltaense NCPPB 1641 TaxID=1183425 RepID=A0A1S7UAG7_9HYPH|nr:hypothetical protein AGR7A_pAt20196 [Agrobacterium deltaense NCPPB 1641]
MSSAHSSSDPFAPDDPVPKSMDHLMDGIAIFLAGVVVADLLSQVADQPSDAAPDFFAHEPLGKGFDATRQH